jgi:hypothetical protein
MPKVGDKHFPYTKAGYAAAAKAKKGRGYKEGGLARSRRNHKGCGAVMEGRRKKTLYVGE